MSPRASLRLFVLLLAALAGLPACAGSGAQRPATPTFIPEFPPTPLSGQTVFYVAPGGNDYAPGTIEQPWASLTHAAEVLEAGETVYVRGGTYAIREQIQPRHSGEPERWITYAAYPGEQPVIDAAGVDFAGLTGIAAVNPHDQGVFNIERVEYIRVYGFSLMHSSMAGFMVRDSNSIDLVNNRVSTTYGPGIGVWSTDPGAASTRHIRVLGNTVTNANTWDMLPPGYPREGEPPHEAISIAGVQDFEVAYNFIYDSDKEGIDVKETSRHGRVHHNSIDHVARQGLYVDAWFGSIEDIELDHNVVTNCGMSGLILSVENGISSSALRVHHNLFYDNLGTGLFFSRWGDGPRRDIQIYQNTLYHNGCGDPNPGEAYYWMTGGLFLYSSNLEDVTIRDNIVAANCAFQIAYSDHWLAVAPNVEAAFREKGILVDHNLLFDEDPVSYPIDVGWPPDNLTRAYGYRGSNALTGSPRFVDPGNGNFLLEPDSPAIDSGTPGETYTDPDGSPADLGAFFFGLPDEFWWQTDFPPLYDLGQLP